MFAYICSFVFVCVLQTASETQMDLADRIEWLYQRLDTNVGLLFCFLMKTLFFLPLLKTAFTTGGNEYEKLIFQTHKGLLVH